MCFLLSDKPRTYKWAEFNEEIQRLENQAKSFEVILNKELEIMKLTPNMRILDAGCGTGAVTRKMAQLVSPKEVYGLDINPLFIDSAKKLAENEGIENIRFEQGDIDNLPYEDNYFDLSYCRGVLMHVNDPVKTVSEMARVTKPGGIVAVSDLDDGGMIGFPHSTRFFDLWARFGQWRKEEGENRYIGRELFSIFSLAGLNSIRIYPFPIYATQENPLILRALVYVPLEVLSNSKDLMIDAGLISEKEFREMVDELEMNLVHPGGFAMGLLFFATGLV